MAVIAPNSATYTQFSVDNILLDLNTISSISGNLNLSPATGQNVVIDSAMFKETGTFGWRDIISELHTRTGANAPLLTQFRNGIYLWAFPDSASKEVFANFHVDHDYAAGTTIFVHIHWSPTTTSTGIVRWGFEWTVAKGHGQSSGSVYAATVPDTADSGIEYVNHTISSGVAYKHYITEMVTGISSTLLEPDSVILVRVFRDTGAVDTFPDNAFGITIDCHYQCDRMSTKNRTPNFYS